MLNKRETTAEASANAAIAVKEPRSCQTADINNNAIQIVADAANHAVTGCLMTTLTPHPIMMIATANVRRFSQRAWSSRRIAFVPQVRRVLMPALPSSKQRGPLSDCFRPTIFALEPARVFAAPA
jgi:hypothetical protein